MAKFGLFIGDRDQPEQEFDGEFLQCNPQGACVAVNVMRSGDQGLVHIFAVIRLAENSCVKEIK